MLTKNSPEVQNLLNRIQEVVPGITGPLGNLWDHHAEVGIEMTFDQEPPTEWLREFRPGHYSLVVLYVDVAAQLTLGWSGLEDTPAPMWAVEDYNCGQWLIPFIPEDEALLNAIMHPDNTGNTGRINPDWL